ncbi:hypothetical protein D3C80_1821910 [compost metagenome]
MANAAQQSVEQGGKLGDTVVDGIEFRLRAKFDPLPAAKGVDADAWVGKMGDDIFAGDRQLFAPDVGQEEAPGRRADAGR